MGIDDYLVHQYPSLLKYLILKILTMSNLEQVRSTNCDRVKSIFSRIAERELKKDWGTPRRISL